MNENKSYEIEISDEDEKKVEQNKTSDQKNSEQLNNMKMSEDKEQECSDDNKYLEQLQRLQAEFVNYKKRIEKERLEFSDFFKSELASSLLPVIDDFEHMLNHTNDEDNEFLTGIRLIYQKLLGVLEVQGLKPVEAVGRKFDPRFHEAVLIETIDDGEDDIVAEEWRKGYLFNERLLRPAQVKVLKIDKVNES